MTYRPDGRQKIGIAAAAAARRLAHACAATGACTAACVSAWALQLARSLRFRPGASARRPACALIGPGRGQGGLLIHSGERAGGSAGRRSLQRGCALALLRVLRWGQPDSTAVRGRFTGGVPRHEWHSCAQVRRVRAPWIKHAFFLDDGTYLIPNVDTLVVGGLAQVRAPGAGGALTLWQALSAHRGMRLCRHDGGPEEWERSCRKGVGKCCRTRAAATLPLFRLATGTRTSTPGMRRSSGRAPSRPGRPWLRPRSSPTGCARRRCLPARRPVGCSIQCGVMPDSQSNASPNTRTQAERRAARRPGCGRAATAVRASSASPAEAARPSCTVTAMVAPASRCTGAAPPPRCSSRARICNERRARQSVGGYCCDAPCAACSTFPRWPWARRRLRRRLLKLSGIASTSERCK